MTTDPHGYNVTYSLDELLGVLERYHRGLRIYRIEFAMSAQHWLGEHDVAVSLREWLQNSNPWLPEQLIEETEEALRALHALETGAFL